MRMPCTAAVALILVIAVVIACQTSTAAPTPTAQTATLWASAEAKECLLNPECSGLFTTGRVVKAEVLRSAEPARYWIDSLHRDSHEDVIRDKIMPIIEQWTHRPWTEEHIGMKWTDEHEAKLLSIEYYIDNRRPVPREILDAVDDARRDWYDDIGELPDPQDILLRWYDDVPEHWGRFAFLSCNSHKTGGCATLGQAEIVLYHPIWDGLPHGGTVLNYDSTAAALHEVVHALYGGEHSNEGLMSINANSHSIRPVDHEIYTLYGNPLITNGMSKELVEQIVQVRE